MRFRVFMQIQGPWETFVVKEVIFPDGEGKEPPDTLLQAVRFAADFGLDPGDTVDFADFPPIITASFKGTLGGEPCAVRYLVGFRAPDGA